METEGNFYDFEILPARLNRSGGDREILELKVCFAVLKDFLHLNLEDICRDDRFVSIVTDISSQPEAGSPLF